MHNFYPVYAIGHLFHDILKCIKSVPFERWIALSLHLLLIWIIHISIFQFKIELYLKKTTCFQFFHCKYWKHSRCDGIVWFPISTLYYENEIVSISLFVLSVLFNLMLMNICLFIFHTWICLFYIISAWFSQHRNVWLQWRQNSIQLK